MKGERRLLRVGEYLVGHACRRLPAGVRDERYREWAAELPAILHDPDTRLTALRAARMLGYAGGTIRGTALEAGKARRRLIVLMTYVGGLFVINALVVTVVDISGAPNAGWDFLFYGILSGSIFNLLWRLKRNRSRDDELTKADEARAHARRALPVTASAGQAVSRARGTASRFHRVRWRPGYQTAEVDEFIARIEATLAGDARPGRAVSAADVEAVKFGTTRRGGYDEMVVDEALDCYADGLARLAPSPDSMTGPDTDPRT